MGGVVVVHADMPMPMHAALAPLREAFKASDMTEMTVTLRDGQWPAVHWYEDGEPHAAMFVARYWDEREVV